MKLTGVASLLLWSILGHQTLAFTPQLSSTKKCHRDVSMKAINRRRQLVAAAAAVLISPVSKAWAADGEKTLHIVDYPIKGKCGQAEVPEAGVFFAKNLGGMVEGSCVTDGYTTKEGTASGITDKDKQRTFYIYGKE